MFGIGGFELFIILVFGFLIVGPDKLPEIARTIGKGIARFRQAQDEMNETFKGEKIFDPSNTEEPFKNPLDVLDRAAQRQEAKKAAQKGTASASGEVADGSENAETGKKAAASGAVPGEGKQEPAARESFSERKARYEREKAAKAANEANEAKSAEAAQVKKGSTANPAAGAKASAAPKPSEEAQASEGASEQAAPTAGGEA